MNAEAWNLVDRARAGGPDAADAFADLYRQYQPDVFRYLVWRTGTDRYLAEDLTSETFVKAWRSIGALRWQGSDPGAWFMTIARNLLYDHFKSGRHRLEVTIGDRSYDGEDAEVGIVRVDPAPGPADQVETGSVVAMVRALVADLPERQREVVRLRYLEERSIEETARLLGVNEGMVKAMAWRAMNRLRRTLEAAA